MPTKNKPRKEQLLAFIGVGVLILALIVLIFMDLIKPPSEKPKKDPLADIGIQTQATEPPETEPPTPEKNHYKPGDFSFDINGYLKCDVAESRMGVDVSEWQGRIDWEQVKKAGVEYAIIRVGGRYSTDGRIFTDTRFRENMEGALAAGLEVGVYFFSQAITTEEAWEEAAWLLEKIEGYDITMPVVFDWEDQNDRTRGIDPELLTTCAKVFCGAVKQAGYEPMLYFNPHHGEYLFNLLELEDYSFWLAMYSSAMDYPYDVEMWQYTCTGTVPGITGDVDINLTLP